MNIQSLAPLLICLLLLVSCTNHLPVRLTDRVAATSVGDLTKKASRPVKGEGIYPATLIDMDTEETVEVDNATDLYSFMDQG